MTATIIPFPSVGAATHAADNGMDAVIDNLLDDLMPRLAVLHLQATEQQRNHWTDWDDYLFEHLQRCDGRSAADAATIVEREIASRRVLDTGTARLLRQAREALGLLKPSYS